MLYKTHKAGGALGAMLLFGYMQGNDMLIEGLTPLLQLGIMYSVSSWASTSADLDHGISSVKEQTPFNLVCHKLLHLTKPVHRSWQTHCLLLTGSICILLLNVVGYLQGNSLGLSQMDVSIITSVVFGLIAGWGSHLVLDMLTMAGVHLIPGVMVRLVPKSSKFATGGLWERIIRVLLYIVIGITGLWLIKQGFGWTFEIFGVTI